MGSSTQEVGFSKRGGGGGWFLRVAVARSANSMLLALAFSHELREG